MLAKQAVTAIVFGAVLMALGLIPGPLAALRDGIRNFRDLITQSPVTPVQAGTQRGERLPGQSWLTAAGAVAVIIGLLVLVSN